MTDSNFAAAVGAGNVSTEAAAMLTNFWPNATNEIRNIRNVCPLYSLTKSNTLDSCKLEDNILTISQTSSGFYVSAVQAC